MPDRTVKKREAFSLLELVLVVLLLAVVYAVVISSGFKVKNSKVRNSLSPDIWLRKDDMKIVIYDNCSKIAKYNKEGNLTKEALEIPLQNFQVFSTKTFEEYTFADEIIDGELHNVCLVFKRNSNYTLKPIILHVNNIFYLIKPFKEEIQEFDTFEAVKNYENKEEFLPTDRQRYYYE